MDVRHEAFPGELDVCDVCGEVYADRLEHGHILYRGREQGPFRPQLLELAEEYEAKFPRALGRFVVGHELFNVVDMEDFPPWRMEWFVSRRTCVPLLRKGRTRSSFRRGLKRWQTPRRDVIHLGVGDRRVWTVEPSRELPVWGVFLEPLKPFLLLPGPNRAERRGRIEANDGSGFTWKRGG